MKTISLIILFLFPFTLFAQLNVGTKAPEIKLEQVYNYNSSETLSMESLKGKIVILDFWATWCSPCVAAFPEYNRLYNKFKDRDVKFIAITDDSELTLNNFLEKMKVDFIIGRDDDKQEFNNYKVNGRPQIYIINRKGDIVHQGNKITDKLIEEVLSKDKIKLEDKKEYNKVISNGGFSPGEDPVYNAVFKMLGKERKDKQPLIEQFIIRPSLETEFGGSGSKKTKAGYIGITLSGYSLKELVKSWHSVSSSLWIKDNTDNETLYDIIYWKKTDSFKTANSEIKQKFTDGISIKIDTIIKSQEINVLSIQSKNESLKLKKEIKDGTSKFYKHILTFISLLENKSEQYHILDDTLKNIYIETGEMSWKELNNLSQKEIINFLNTRGIILKQENREIKLYEINQK